MPGEDGARERVRRLEALLERLDDLYVPARDAAHEAVQAVVQLYGEALGRIVDVLAEREDGAELTAALVEDELVSHLLALHDLHPESLEARVARALEGVRPALRARGGRVELVGVEAGVARLRLGGTLAAAGTAGEAMRQAVEGAVRALAPELERVEGEGAAAPGLVQLTRERRGAAAGAGAEGA